MLTYSNFPSRLHYYLLAGLLWTAFYLGCGSYALLDMNEGLYAEIAREMLSTHTFLIPHLNYVPYLEKPPLLYWLLALSYQLFGVSAFAARFVPSTCAVLACLSVVWFGKKINREEPAWLAALILASSLGFCLIGRTVFFDMLLNSCLWLSLWCFYLWYAQEDKLYLRLAYVGLAAGLLTKGFVALIFPGVTALLFLLTERCSWRKRLALFDLWGILLFLAIALPWHILAVLKQPNFAWDYFINEQWNRFLDKRIPNDYHTGPWYFYFPYILVYLFPWSLLLPALFKSSFKDSLQKFLWLGFLVPMVFYSVAKAKGDYYMVVGMPFLAMLLGIRLHAWLQAGKTWPINSLWCSLMILSFISLVIVYWANFHAISSLSWLQLPLELKPTVKWVLATNLILFILAVFIWRTQPGLPFLILAVFGQFLILSYVFTRPLQQFKYSQLAAAEYLLSTAKDQTVYLYQDFERFSSLLFYLQRRLPIIDSQSHDLYFGSHTTEAKQSFLTGDKFIQQCRFQTCYVVLCNDKLGEFQLIMAKTRHWQQVFNSGKALIYRLSSETQ